MLCIGFKRCGLCLALGMMADSVGLSLDLDKRVTNENCDCSRLLEH